MKLIVMLTHNDVTVANAKEVFESCTDLPVCHWGFKNIGLPVEEMKDLAKAIKAAGKVTHMEIVSYTEEECLAGAKLAIECGIDYLLGTKYFPSVAQFLKNSSTKYFPFCGDVWGSPSILGNSIEEIIEDAKRLEGLGVDGIDLLAYRFFGNSAELITQFSRSVKIPLVIAGSINSFDRLNFVNQIQPWGFTIGSALFTHQFMNAASFRKNLICVLSYLQGIMSNKS
ncbi:hypothetical protein [Desulfosporosinus sp. BICA1-9]|uniref:hypothetical protein n=1 Tax=Desulfosporosinus sp. BICA1-9 TaxID=1531958 RepID=UPI00054B732D|nr:hypothetical protein [Desulfosporosinus sp. BICA1-9]KJS50830.1 MAG: hypothetical protein VR66_00640 [Peptococcaceae bacterium BRH_c23]KJS83446.1 MAG: hypothetical protein JL57_22705 [Desulfosporosinus sp. BICA1-9]HBW37376.1 hypothetical protein [Desulfosporosinus sp.]